MPLPVDDERVGEIFGVLDSTGSIEDALDVLVRQGLAHLPDFGLLDVSGDRPRVIVRGSIRAERSDGDPVVGSGFLTDLCLDSRSTARLTVDDDDAADPVVVPIGLGVVQVRSIGLAGASLTEANEASQPAEAPESDDAKGKGATLSAGVLGAGAATVGGIALAGSLGSIDVDGPSVDLPDLEVERPGLDLSVPDLDVDAVDVAIDTPDVDLDHDLDFDHDLDVDAPTIDVDGPKFDVDGPKFDVDAPKFDLDAPTIDIDGGGIDLDKPEIDLPEITKPDIDLPDIDVERPDIDLDRPDVDVPDVDLDLKKPDVDLPGFGFTKPDVDLPDVDLAIDKPKFDLDAPDIDLPDIDEPTIEVDTPAFALSAPDIDVSAPDVDLDKPHIDIEKPDFDLSAPDLDVKKPDVDVDVPDIDLKKPDIDIDAPDVDLDKPDFDVNAPDIDLTMPQVDVDAPDLDLSAPKVDIDGPDVDGPKFGLGDYDTVPAPVFTPPNGEINLAGEMMSPGDIDLSSPDVDLAAPSVDFSAPDIDVSAPDIDIEKPDVDLSSPDIDLAAPDIDLSAPDVDLAKPDFDLEKPDFDLSAPDLDLKKPDLDIAAPDVDLQKPDVDIDAPDIDITKPNLDVNAPDVDLTNPDIDLDAPQVGLPLIDGDVSTPEIDFDAPDVDGPKFGLGDYDTVPAPVFTPPNGEINLAGEMMSPPVVDLNLPDLEVAPNEADLSLGDARLGFVSDDVEPSESSDDEPSDSGTADDRSALLMAGFQREAEDAAHSGWSGSSPQSPSSPDEPVIVTPASPVTPVSPTTPSSPATPADAVAEGAPADDSDDTITTEIVLPDAWLEDTADSAPTPTISPVSPSTPAPADEADKPVSLVSAGSPLGAESPSFDNIPLLGPLEYPSVESVIRQVPVASEDEANRPSVEEPLATTSATSASSPSDPFDLGPLPPPEVPEALLGSAEPPVLTSAADPDDPEVASDQPVDVANAASAAAAWGMTTTRASEPAVEESPATVWDPSDSAVTAAPEVRSGATLTANTVPAWPTVRGMSPKDLLSDPVVPEARSAAIAQSLAQPVTTPSEPVATPSEPVFDEADILVAAVFCPSGHPNPPSAVTCRVCHQLVGPQEPVEVPRPPLGVLRLSSGGTVILDRGVILGRNPHEIIGATGPQPNLVRIADPNKDISSQHLEVRLEDWYVTVRDLGSTNGTQVFLPHRAPIALRPNEPMTIEPGARVVLAQAFDFVFEVPA
ncbi:MAG: FHA domain-containing protein [Propionibacteriaceae bacterium]|nr:FHA domain-containing protein [Propionibacteriaceae bacterium]